MTTSDLHPYNRGLILAYAADAASRFPSWPTPHTETGREMLAWRDALATLAERVQTSTDLTALDLASIAPGDLTGIVTLRYQRFVARDGLDTAQDVAHDLALDTFLNILQGVRNPHRRVA